MKKIRILLIVAWVPYLLGCNDFLDPYPSAVRTEDYIWTNQSTVQGLIGACYDKIASNYNNREGAYLDCATDNAVMTSKTDAIARFANGLLNPIDDIFAGYWEDAYAAIYNVNLFLEDNKGHNTRFLLNDKHNKLLQDRLQGEAYAIRAWFQWQLLQKFGGRGANSGELLGFPILLTPIRVGDLSVKELEEMDFKRNSYDDCVARILQDCDSAFKYLPVAHRDFLAADDEKVVHGSQNWGRFDGITMKAVKALVYLTWASPRFNPNDDMSRWDKAASYAKEVMDFKMNIDNVSNGFRLDKQVTWSDPNNPTIIFASRYNSSSESMEKAFYPGGFQGNGVMGATQEFVDAFGMADGYPIGESPTYTYNPQEPYLNRDNRFYSMIFYNNRTVAAGGGSYTFESWEGGKDHAGLNSKNSLTNLYIKKFVYMGLNWSDKTVNRQPRSKFHIRWAHMVLTFAEAANQVVGPNARLYDLSAKEAISYLRKQTTYDGAAGLSQDPYLELVSMKGKKEFDLFLRNERRIETCFEGTWFYDLRRWSTTLGELNQSLHKVTILRSNAGRFSYKYDAVVDKRVFNSAYLPIPYKEVRALESLEQNQGWETWK